MGHQPASSHPIFPQYVLMFASTDDLGCPRARSPGIGDAKRRGRGQMRFQWPGNDAGPQRSRYPAGYFFPPLGCCWDPALNCNALQKQGSWGAGRHRPPGTRGWQQWVTPPPPPRDPRFGGKRTFLSTNQPSPLSARLQHPRARLPRRISAH